MSDALNTFGSRIPTVTPQSEKAVKGQKKNNAGGFAFTISPMERAKRFLILGSESNHYTAGQKLTKDNAKTLMKLLLTEDASFELIDLIVTVSTEGRAPKRQPALFALALAASTGSDKSRSYALSKLSLVARTGRDLFQFIEYVGQFRGWGQGLQKAVARWYTQKNIDSAAYQIIKYRGLGDRLTHRNVFRLSHPYTPGAEWKGLAQYVIKGDKKNAPKVVKGFEKAKKDGADLTKLIKKHNLSWEMLPTQALNDPKVWETLIENGMPLGALLRQLPRLTKLGVLKPLGDTTYKVIARFANEAEIKKARLHPIQILLALRTYQSGKGDKGSMVWTPVPAISNALDKAFYLSFKTVEASGKRTMIGLDVSGSMLSTFGTTSLTSREATAAMAMVTVATEPKTHVIGFTGSAWGSTRYRRDPYVAFRSSAPASVRLDVDAGVTVLDITASDSLAKTVQKVSNLPFGRTDCALPMLYALKHGIEVDTFVIYTDNETWAGPIHPFEALKKYRQETGLNAKLVVMSTEATPFSIADPNDAGMLDIPGFDSAAPALIADFSRGL